MRVWIDTEMKNIGTLDQYLRLPLLNDATNHNFHYQPPSKGSLIATVSIVPIHWIYFCMLHVFQAKACGRSPDKVCTDDGFLELQEC